MKRGVAYVLFRAVVFKRKFKTYSKFRYTYKSYIYDSDYFQIRMKIDTNCIIHITQNNTTKLINLWNLWQRILFRSTLLLLVHIRRWQLWLPLKLLMNYMTKLNLISQLIRKAILIHIRSVIVWKYMTLKTLVYVCMCRFWTKVVSWLLQTMIYVC